MQQKTQQADELPHCLMREALLKLAELLQLEAQLSTCRRRQLLLTVLSLDMEWLTVTWFMYTARMLMFWVEHSERCMRRRSQESMIWLWRWEHRWSDWSTVQDSDFRKLQMHLRHLEAFITNRHLHQVWFRRLQQSLECAAAVLQLFRGLQISHLWKQKTENFSLILQMHWKEMRFPSVTQQALSTRARQQVL